MSYRLLAMLESENVEHPPGTINFRCSCGGSLVFSVQGWAFTALADFKQEDNLISGRCPRCGKLHSARTTPLRAAEAPRRDGKSADSPRALRLQQLKRELEKARQESRIAAAEFDAIVKDMPSGLPAPDGRLRIRQAGARMNESIRNHIQALE